MCTPAAASARRRRKEVVETADALSAASQLSSGSARLGCSDRRKKVSKTPNMICSRTLAAGGAGARARAQCLETVDALSATPQLFLGLGAARPLCRRQGAAAGASLGGTLEGGNIPSRAVALRPSGGEVVVRGRAASRAPRHQARRCMGRAGRGLAGVDRLKCAPSCRPPSSMTCARLWPSGSPLALTACDLPSQRCSPCAAVRSPPVRQLPPSVGAAGDEGSELTVPRSAATLGGAAGKP